MQNGQIPFPLHLLLRNPPLIWKSSAKSGKKSGKLWKQEIWFHAKMPNRPQPPPQQSCQKIFQRFRHIWVFSSAKNDALFAHTLPSTTVLCSPPANCLQVVCSSITPSVNCRALATPQLETVQVKCQLNSFSHTSTWSSHMSPWLLSAVLWPLDTSVILIVQFDKPMSVRSSHMSARTSHISTILLSAVFRSLDLQDSYYPVWQVNVS